MNKQDLIDFIKEVLVNDFDGCWYYNLGNDLYLVFANDDNNDIQCKVAYNCDDLQCDYDFDWEMPVNKYGDLIGQDWTDLLESGYTAEDLADEVICNYKYIIGCGWKNPVEA